MLPVLRDPLLRVQLLLPLAMPLHQAFVVASFLMLGINGRRIISYLSGTCNDNAGFY